MSTNTAAGAVIAPGPALLDDRPRPPRRNPPVRIRREVCERQGYVCVCGCGQPVHWKPRSRTHFDHEPALELRPINDAGDDYDPPQHDPRHLDARCHQSHHAKTHGTGATTAGTDIGKIKKARKRRKALAHAGRAKPKWAQGRKLQGRGFSKQKRQWPKGHIRPKR